ncbi:glycoside hydrolase family 19 protein [Pantoea dispersa]|uniref:glycoside hydrolase family 19 protein n=1 Tax=Pantoea dispersa TaxID=59814 RepID=UPI000F67D34D|nr:glycoside hydrolase family 19 protein [Pantoea dispersa]RRW77628.1 glycoside hydrolase family 19 protein [Pantoea dispersa]
MKALTLDTFIAAAGVNAIAGSKWFAPITEAMRKYGINQLQDVAMFIAQIGHESASFASLVEGFNYSQGALKSVFGHRLTPAQIASLGRAPGGPAVPVDKQIQIASIVYGGRNGNVQPEDGWRYRGRGLIQITGRANYAACGKAIGTDLISNPEQLQQALPAALSAAWFFTSNGCLKYSGDVLRITRIINGGTNGLDDRKIRYDRAIKALS